MGDNTLNISLKSLDGKYKLCAASRVNPDLILDYFPPFGNGEGYTSQELVLISFASCLTTTVVALLRNKMQREVSEVKVNASGTVRDISPKALSNIDVEIIITSKDATDADIKRALAASEESLCPVWHLLKGNVEITARYIINR